MGFPKKISQLPLNLSVKPEDLLVTVNGNDVTSKIKLEQLTNFLTGSTNSFVTGGTYNNITQNIDFLGNSGFPPFSVNLSQIVDSDTFVTGATLNGLVLEIDRNNGEPQITVDLSSLTGDTDTNTFITGATLVGTNYTLERNDGVDITTDLSSLSGTTPTIDEVIAAGNQLTNNNNSLNFPLGGELNWSTFGGQQNFYISNSDAASTYIRIVNKGGELEMDDSMISLASFDGKDLELKTGSNTDDFRIYLGTNGPSVGDVLEVKSLDGNTGLMGWATLSPDNSVTGFTYNDNNTFTITDKEDNSFSATINQMSGLTITNFFQDTIKSGSTYEFGQEFKINLISDSDPKLEKFKAGMFTGATGPTDTNTTVYYTSDTSKMILGSTGTIQSGNTTIVGSDSIDIGPTAEFNLTSGIGGVVNIGNYGLSTPLPSSTINIGNNPNNTNLNIVVNTANITGDTSINGLLSISNLGVGPSLNNLGIDSNGFVVVGATDENVFVNSGTANVATQELTLTNTTGGTFNVTNAAALFSDNDINVTGGTYNINSGCVTFRTNSGSTFDVCGFITGLTDTFVDNASLIGTTYTLSRTDGTLISTDFNPIVSGKVDTAVFSSYSALTQMIIDTKLDKSIFNTYTANTTDNVVTGATLVGGTLDLKRNNGLTDVTVDLSSLSGTSENTFVSGGTISASANTLTLNYNNGNSAPPINGINDLPICKIAITGNTGLSNTNNGADFLALYNGEVYNTNPTEFIRENSKIQIVNSGRYMIRARYSSYDMVGNTNFLRLAAISASTSTYLDLGTKLEYLDQGFIGTTGNGEASKRGSMIYNATGGEWIGVVAFHDGANGGSGTQGYPVYDNTLFNQPYLEIIKIGT